jgi:hypothetical protein
MYRMKSTTTLSVDMFAYNAVMQVLTITDNTGMVHSFTKFTRERFHNFMRSECKHKAFNMICDDYPKVSRGAVAVGFIS